MALGTQSVEILLYLLVLLLQLTTSCSSLKHLTVLLSALQPLFSSSYLTRYHIVKIKPLLYQEFRVQTFPSSSILLVILMNIYPNSEFVISGLFSVMFVGFSANCSKQLLHTSHIIATNIVLILLLNPGVGLILFLLIVMCVITIILHDTRPSFSSSEYILVTTFLSYVVYKTIFDENSEYVVFMLLTIAAFLVTPPQLERDTSLIVMSLFCWFLVIFYKNYTSHLIRIENIIRRTWYDVQRHPNLVYSWVACTLGAVTFTVIPGLSVNLHLQRKVYHVFICVVYISGIIIAPTLLSTACLAATFVMLFCQIMYYRGVTQLTSCLRKFCGSQDTGSLVLTPFFLLLGLSIPVWWRYGVLSDISTRDITTLLHTVLPYSGVLSVGVGDAAAAFVGVQFGRSRMPGSQKSVEGMLGNILGQVMFLAMINPYLVWGWYRSVDFILLGFVILGNALLEVYTQDIDNLVIPLFVTVTLHVLQKLPLA